MAIDRTIGKVNVSDASPLIVLATIGYFDLLSRLYSKVYISSDVYAEVVIFGKGLPGWDLVPKARWIEVRQLQNRALLLPSPSEVQLDVGELSSIFLAKEIGVKTVLMDEVAGRKLARRQGLDVRGVVGILEALFRQGDIEDLRDAFIRVDLSCAYVSRQLLNHRLDLLGLPPI